MYRVKLLMISLLMISPCVASDEGNLQKENTFLQQRVGRLEKEVQELKKLVTQQQEKAAKQAPAPVVEKEQEKPAQPAPQLSQEDLQKIYEMVAKQQKDKKAVWSNLDIQLYGYLRLDASYDTSRTYPGNYVVWVDSEATNRDDDEFNMTANQTRLGLKVAGPSDGGIETSGVLEFDFYGNYAEENKAKIQMRHAYLNLNWPEDRFSILAGQTSDTMSPLVPDTLNYTVLWDAGNIGYRRPQIRLTKIFAVDKNTDLQLEGAIARTIGRSSPTSSESGEDAGYPTFQGRASLKFANIGYKPTIIGFSGHFGREEYDINDMGSNTSGKNKKFESWSMNIDFTVPMSKWLTVKGELFTGENLNTYFGGIGQGVNTTTRKEIEAKGGWVAATLGPWDKFRFNIGTGIDDVDSDDINAGDRTLNRSVFGNVIYAVNKNAEIGLELSQWRTDYKGRSDSDALRIQTCFTYKF